MIPLTVMVTCFNEEACIRGCLESVSWADEILVVDSFSTDRTLEIAAEFSPRILQHAYENAAAQKNWAIPQARHEWVLIVDCDERVTPELREEIRTLLSGSPTQDGYWIRRHNDLFGKRIRYVWGKDRVLRLFRRDVGRYEAKRVHAHIRLEKAGILKAALEHDSIRSMEKWTLTINRYTTWKARDKFERGARWAGLACVVRPPLRFFKDFILRRGILDGWRGFVIAAMSAHAEFLMSAKLLVLCLNKRQNPSVTEGSAASREEK